MHIVYNTPGSAGAIRYSSTIVPSLLVESHVCNMKETEHKKIFFCVYCSSVLCVIYIYLYHMCDDTLYSMRYEYR